MVWVWIAAGGAAGAVLRYAVAGWVQGLGAPTFPWGTLAVNVAGCLAIGLLTGLLAGPLLVRPEVRLGLLVGLLGGFTTFSTFAYETVVLLEDARAAAALWNLGLANGAGMVAVWVGHRLAVLLGGA